MAGDSVSSLGERVAHLRHLLTRTVLGQLFLRISLVLVPALAILTLLQWRNAAAVSRSLDDERVAGRLQSLASRAMLQLAIQEDATKSMLLEPDRVSEESSRKIMAFDARLAAVDTMQQLLPSATLQRHVAELARLDSTELSPLETQILEQLLEGRRGPALQLFREKYVPSHAAYGAEMERVERFADSVMHAAQIGAEVKTRQANVQLGLGVSVLLLILLIGYLTAGGQLAKRLASFTEALDALGHGTLSARPTLSGADEIAQLHATLGNVAAGMRGALQAEQVDWSAVGRDREERVRQEALARDLAAREQAQLEDTRRKVDQLLLMIEAAGTGDLTQRSPVTGDDALGRMGAGLDALVGDLRKNMARIRGEAGDLTTASADLRSTADRTAQHAETITSEIRTVSESASLSSEAVSSAAAATEELNASIREIARSAEQAAQLARETAGSTAATLEAVRALDHSTGQIGSLLGSINAIAEKTNLLALNATIEAARAGEAGRGFAIVANEVKELARSTRSVTGDIGEKLGAITSEAAQVGAAIRQMSDAVQKIAAVQESVANAAEEQSAVTNEMAHKLASAANGGDDVASAVARLGSLADEGTRTSGSMRESAVGLSEIADSLATLVQRFRIDAGHHPERRAVPRHDGAVRS